MQHSGNQSIGIEKAKELAGRFFGYFPNGAASDPEVFATGVVQLFEAYSLPAVEAILSPLSGLPAKQEFLPSLAKIRAALEEQEAWGRRMAGYGRRSFPDERPLLPKPEPEVRPTLGQLRAKHGENWGLSAQPKGRRGARPTAFRPLRELLAEAGVCEAEFEKQQAKARQALRKVNGDEIDF